MKFKTKSIGVMYESTFARIAPEISSESANVISHLIARIAPRYPIASQNIRVFPSSVLSEFKIQVDLFGTAGRLEVYVDRFVATFNDAANRQDVKTIEECLALALDGLGDALPNLSISADNLLVRLRLDLHPDGENDNWCLDHYLSSNSYGKLTGETLELLPGIKLALHSKEQGWRMAFDIAPAWEDPKHAIVSSLQIFFTVQNGSMSVADKAKLIADYVFRFLGAFDLAAVAEEP